MPCESMVAVPTSKLMLPFRAVVPGTTAWVICCVVVVVGMGCSDPSSDDDDCPPWIGTEAYYESESDGNCMFVPECVEEEDEGPTDMSDLAPYSNPSYPPSGTSPPTGTPPTWLYHSGTGTFYRLATEFEQEEHGWPEGTTVFTAPTVVNALINGTNSAVTVGIPVSYYTMTGGPFLTLQTLTVQRRRTMNDVTYVTSQDLAMGPLVETFRPEFHLFLPSWVELEDLGDGVPSGTTMFAAVFGDSHGGVAIEGIRADQTFSVLGPSDSLWLESTPPSTGAAPGVLVLKPSYQDTDFNDVLAHWLELADEGCGGTCTWEADDGLPPGNCGDGLENDRDCAIDGEDWFCQHRSDFGCDNFDEESHRWENSKDFAMLPDIQWCTQMQIDGMPWYSDLYSKGTTAATLLNAIKLAAQIDPNVSAPVGIPRINYRFGYCVFADTIDDAIDCSIDSEDCPEDYKVGGFGDDLDDNNNTERTLYFAALWDELDVAMHKAENNGIAAKPVAMVSAIFSGELRDDLSTTPIGLSAKIGNLGREDYPHLLGASTVEAENFAFRPVAHENGHCLGLSHTDVVEQGEYWAGKTGFMFYNTSGGFYAILGPIYTANDGYGYASQWAGWAALFPNKEIPRPNAFDHTGCTEDWQCPEPEYCWNSGTNGICFLEEP
jgi:hypothetical protein